MRHLQTFKKTSAILALFGAYTVLSVVGVRYAIQPTQYEINRTAQLKATEAEAAIIINHASVTLRQTDDIIKQGEALITESNIMIDQYNAQQAYLASRSY